MIRPGKQKSRTFRRVFRKTPGGVTRLFYKRRKPAKATCATCGALLKGMPREIPYKMRNMAKTKKRPERPCGGMLCSKCLREKFKTQIYK